MSGDPIAVIGGGLAGIAAAERLSARGRRVLLFEQRQSLGGRASSFRDPETGWLLENGQHVWMPACTHLEDLIRRTGVDHLVYRQPRLRVPFVERGREPYFLEEVDLPGPLSLLLPLLRFAGLGLAARSRMLLALAVLRLGGGGSERGGSEEVFGRWLRRWGQDSRTCDVFWDPFIGSVLNEPARTARSDLAAFAVRESLLGGKGRARLCWTLRPHGAVWERAVGGLEGVEVVRGEKVEALHWEGGRVRGIRTASGSDHPAAGVVAALTPSALQRLLPEEVALPGVGLEWSPILNVHVWYAEPVTSEPVICVVGSPLHWIFAKPPQEPEGGRHPVPRSAQHLNLVVSASREWLGKGPDQIVPQLGEEAAAHLPAARAVPILASRVVHERRATFRAVPGSEPHRPGPGTAHPNLTIAGAWTATGWPSTLEGAVRSGRTAADLLVNED